MNMRNPGKFFAAVVTIALIVTSTTAAFAADSLQPSANESKAVILKDLGLYSGEDAAERGIGLENALTTQNSLIFLAKLFGYYETSNSLTDEEVAQGLARFDDAAGISDYARKVVAYSAINGVLSGSTKDDKFYTGAKDTVTAARFATFMLRQMGYHVQDFKQSVARLAETKGSRIDATITGELTRDVAVGVMYGALTAERADGKTVIIEIAGDDAELREKFENIGLIQPTPEQPATTRHNHPNPIEYPEVDDKLENEPQAT